MPRAHVPRPAEALPRALLWDPSRSPLNPSCCPCRCAALHASCLLPDGSTGSAACRWGRKPSLWSDKPPQPSLRRTSPPCFRRPLVPIAPHTEVSRASRARAGPGTLRAVRLIRPRQPGRGRPAAEALHRQLRQAQGQGPGRARTAARPESGMRQPAGSHVLAARSSAEPPATAGAPTDPQSCSLQCRHPSFTREARFCMHSIPWTI